MRLPPLNNMLNRDIASTYLHKGWISISDKIYLLHGFYTSSTSEMVMYKELNTAIIYIYTHDVCTYIYNTVYIYYIYMSIMYTLTYTHASLLQH